MRISRQAMLMEVAKTVAKRATCFRLNVGAVVVEDNSNIISYGYNGQAPGAPHCPGHTCPGASACKETIHAEVNALNRAKSRGWKPLDLYVTDSPCADCAKYILEDGRVHRVFFATPYRILDGLDLLMRGGVMVYRILPAGYVIDWSTQQLVPEEAL